METFSITDLRERSGELARQAEAGHLSIVVKHGRPLFIAVPMDEHLLKEGDVGGRIPPPFSITGPESVN